MDKQGYGLALVQFCKPENAEEFAEKAKKLGFGVSVDYDEASGWNVRLWNKGSGM